MGTIVSFSKDDGPRPPRPDGTAARPRRDVKEATISCRGTETLDAHLKRAARKLDISKSQLVHDIAIKFLEQMGIRSLPKPTKLNRAQRTRELARELFELWGDEPETVPADQEAA